MSTFDIFRGHYKEADVIWLAAVQGDAAVRERLEEIVKAKPGCYFVYSAESDAVVLQIDGEECPRGKHSTSAA